MSTEAGFDRSRKLDAATAALLDAIPDSTAVLDRDGVITAVNHTWAMFARDNGGSIDRFGVGTNYLDVCERASGNGCEDARLVAEGLRAVFRGETVECDFEYACPSPAVGRWFVLRATPIGAPLTGALVSHVNITARKLAEHDLARLAGTDPLTGLANRARFADQLAASMGDRPQPASRPDIGVLYLDLDDFKPVNDRFGHAAGDEILQVVAGRLLEIARPQDTIARLGGDEFGIVLPRITADGLMSVASRIESVLAAPHLIHGESVVVRASVGVYLAHPDEDPDDVIAEADERMYTAKSGRGGHHHVRRPWSHLPREQPVRPVPR